MAGKKKPKFMGAHLGSDKKGKMPKSMGGKMKMAAGKTCK